MRVEWKQDVLNAEYDVFPLMGKDFENEVITAISEKMIENDREYFDQFDTVDEKMLEARWLIRKILCIKTDSMLYDCLCDYYSNTIKVAGDMTDCIYNCVIIGGYMFFTAPPIADPLDTALLHGDGGGAHERMFDNLIQERFLGSER